MTNHYFNIFNKHIKLIKSQGKKDNYFILTEGNMFFKALIKKNLIRLKTEIILSAEARKELT